MKNIVLIDNEPFTKRRDQLFYISRLRGDGFDVQVWDVSTFFSTGSKFPDIIVADYVIKIENIEHLKVLLSKVDIPSTFFIVEASMSDDSYPIYKVLKEKHCFIARFDFFSNSNIPLAKGTSRKTDCIQKLYLNFRAVCHKVRNIFHSIRWYGIKYDVFLSPRRIKGVTGGINHPDYNDFLLNNQTPLLNYDYIVFCDQYFPLHPEVKNVAPNINVEKYYAQMRKLFDVVEKTSGMPVVIASHPKAEYEGCEFGNRNMIKYQTMNLVMNSKKVIFHTSNSLSFSVLANKEILCVYTDDFVNSNIGEYQLLLGIKNALKINIYNIDQVDLKEIKFEKINKEQRKSYIYDYLTTKGTKDLDNYYIIKSLIEKSVYLKR